MLVVRELNGEYLLNAIELVKYFPVKKGLFTGARSWVRAVDGVSLSVRTGENVAIVGESGSGKTTLARMLAGIIHPTSGRILYSGVPLDSMSRLQIARFVQPVFQDPVGALNPVTSIRGILSRPFKIHKIPFDDERLIKLLEQVGLSPGESFLKRLPHQLSGGQRQRVAIARALALEPKLIIADEPFSGLDPTVQTQILSLLLKIQQMHSTTYLIVSHDINLVRAICKWVVVMYLGKIVESGPADMVISNPMHPYTVSLINSLPSPNPEDTAWVDSPPLLGDIPSAINPPSGCRFRTRCSFAKMECSINEPRLIEYEKDHYVACPIVTGKGW